MVLIVFLPGFGLHDCKGYYKVFLQHLERLHTVRFIDIDGYTHSVCRYLGDVDMSTILRECADVCNNLTEPYFLVGHSSGALIAGHMYPLLVKKPLEVLLMNPMNRAPRIRIVREWVPLPVCTMWMLDWLPIPLYLKLYSAKVFGSEQDIVTMMKFRLWRDLVSSMRTLRASLPKTHITIITSSRDPLGGGLGTLEDCTHHEYPYPGHASFRSMTCITAIKELFTDKSTDQNLFNDMYTDL
jgi:hypothetical protein